MLVNKLQHLKRIFLDVICLLVLSSCSRTEPPGVQPAITALPAVTSVQTAIVQEPTVEIQATSSLTPTPAITPTATWTPPPTPTLTPTSAPTWTPDATLSPQKARALVKDLLANNGGCQFPCWWGMIPGRTDWNTAKHFLDTFVKKIEVFQDYQKIKVDFPVHIIVYIIRYETGDGVEDNFTVDVENGMIFAFMVSGFRVQQLLTNYGPPDEVYIHAEPYHSDGSPPTFTLAVYYGQKYFWTEYEFEGKIVGNTIQGCLQSVYPLRTRLGSPNKDWTVKDMMDWVFGVPTQFGVVA
jgi:hypothetical protein